MNTLTPIRNKMTGTIKMMACAVLLLASTANNSYGQAKVVRKTGGETYGHSLNLGLGIGYYSYLYGSVPFFFINYEFDVARNFTLAPFLGVASYRSHDHYAWGGHHYYYHQTVMPMGVKGTYYFDNLLGASPKWDFYLAASLGFVYNRVVWDDGYYGPTTLSKSASPLYLGGHIGTEYHASKKVGIFLDLSTGVSTVGLAVHF